MKTFLILSVLMAIALMALLPLKQFKQFKKQILSAIPRFMLGLREQLTMPVRAWHRIKYRKSQTLCLSNVASNPADAMEHEKGYKSYYAETGLLNALPFLLVKQGATGSEWVDLCGASDLPLGTVTDTATVAGTVAGYGSIGDRVNVHFLGKGSTSRMVANGVISAGVNVYAATGGKISSTGTQIVGVSISAAGADLDVIEVIDQPVFPAPGIAASLFDANTILYATADNTPLALTVGASTLVGRGGSGAIVANTPTQAHTILGSSHKIVFAGLHAWAGGAATTDAQTVTGLVAASDIVIATLTARASTETLVLAVGTTDTITYTLGANGTNTTTKISYMVLRAV